MIDVGLLVNPVAGIGGSAALKGREGLDRQAVAVKRGGRPGAARRVMRTLRAVATHPDIRWHAWGGDMGLDLLSGCGIQAELLGNPASPSSAADTRRAARFIMRSGVNLLVFAGGDGTARDVLAAVGQSLPVLGIPAGVKMHSGVFATTPEVAAHILERLAQGGLVSATPREVCDWEVGDDTAETIRPQFFGELLVPELSAFVQHTKEAGRESEPLAVNEIAAHVVEGIDDFSGPWVLGPGSTLAAIKTALGMQATLLGIDVIYQGSQIGIDVDANWLHQHIVRPARIVISFTRNQGFLLGRGNQQLSATLLGRLGQEAITIVGTRTKLLSLNGRPLLVDTDDPQLDREFTGLMEIVAGYQDRLLYRVATHA